jgi:hypothetical protein
VAHHDDSNILFAIRFRGLYNRLDFAYGKINLLVYIIGGSRDRGAVGPSSWLTNLESREATAVDLEVAIRALDL